MTIPLHFAEEVQQFACQAAGVAVAGCMAASQAAGVAVAGRMAAYLAAVGDDLYRWA